MQRSRRKSRGCVPRVARVLNGGLPAVWCLPFASSMSERAGERAGAVASTIQQGQFAPNAFIRIDHSGKTTLVMPQVEMGQGVYTAIPMILAEELDADFAKVAAGARAAQRQALRQSDSSAFRPPAIPIRSAPSGSHCASPARRRGRCWCRPPPNNGRSIRQAVRPPTARSLTPPAAARWLTAIWWTQRAYFRCRKTPPLKDSERFRADRQAAQAPRHAGQDRRQRRLRHRRHASRDEVRDAGGMPGVRRQGRACRRQRRENSSRACSRSSFSTIWSRWSATTCGPPRKASTLSIITWDEGPHAQVSSEPHLGGPARREQEGRRGREIRRRHRRRVCRRARDSTASSSCRSWRTRRWSR